MTKKDYVAIAQSINSAVESSQGPDITYKRAVADIIVKRLADVLAADNPKFLRNRFLSACGVEQS